MRELFTALEHIFFSKIVGEIDLYTILSTVLKFVFVVIVLSFIYTIVKMITQDIRSTWQQKAPEAAYLKLLSNAQNYDFPVRNEYYLSDNTTIGRADDNAIVIKDPRMSKYQARIIRENGRFFIDDLGATNPTLVNERSLKQPIELKTRDLVTLGDLDFAFVNGAEHEK
ncbi:MAG: FHA domain-containing protein [Ndongobacter sp.]|nr:FHA domain-containing protein [Ndongobacter sp.]